MEPKRVNCVKGSIIFKIVLYMLITITAFSTVVTAGIIAQMGSYGLLDNMNNEQESIDEQMCRWYLQHEKENDLYNITDSYINKKYSEFDNLISKDEDMSLDIDSDGVLTYADLANKINSADFKEHIEHIYKGDGSNNIAYRIEIVSSYDSDKILAKYEKNVSTLSSYDKEYIEDVTTYSWEMPSIDYSYYPSEKECERAEDIINEGRYRNSDIYEYGYEYSVISAFSGINSDNSTSVRVIKITYFDMMNLDIRITCWANPHDVVSAERLSEVESNLSRYYSIKKIAIYGFIISAIICFVLTIMSMAFAGVKKGETEIRQNAWERFPGEIIATGLTVCVILVMFACSEIYSAAVYNVPEYWGVNTYDNILDNYTFWALAVGAACSYLIGILFLNNIVVKIKTKQLIKNTIVYKICKCLFGKEGKISGFVRNVVKKIPLCWQAAIFYLVVIVLSMFVFGIETYFVSYADSVMALALLVVIALVITVLYALFIATIYQLHKGGRELAKGNLSYKIDTKYMFGPFKEHGENLNKINESIQLAVEERIKSERMKTELITNVSHDIKTPLTSIINYVDLLEKEGIDKEPEKSYIDVLVRQSARLKKLILDLVDASKASTGNVELSFEIMDANMVLTQASAEYEDKLAQNNIMLVVSTIDEPALIEADGRHLWRVFDNLLNNAYKYAMPGTRVYAQVDLVNDKVRITFKNISKEPLNISSDELMERFVRGDSSRNTEGSGLGLSIAKSLCNLMGADFEILIDGDLYKAIITFDVTEKNEIEIV